MTREETWQRLLKLKLVKGDMPEDRWSLCNANMRGADLSQADLGNANLSGADFHLADLSNANLSGANLIRACLGLANLDNANLSGTDLRDAACNSAFFIRSTLRVADLKGADLTMADLSMADLSMANLNEANLCGANLHNANLSGAMLFDANMPGVNLSGANLSGANLRQAKLMDSDLSNANMINAELIDLNLNRANLSNATLTGAVFYGVSTTGWKIEGIKVKYMFFTKNSHIDKEKSMRFFPDGKFEELYRSLPTVELIFDQGLSPVELLKLNAVIETLKQQNPSLGLNMSHISIDRDAAHVDIQTAKDESLEEACRVIQVALKKAQDQGISINSFMPQIQQFLACNNGRSELEGLQDGKVEVNLFNGCTFVINKGDGSYTQAMGPQATARSITCNIFHQYVENKETIDIKFGELKDELRESTNSQKELLINLTDLLIEELSSGKDAGMAQKLWDEIKEGIKTGGGIAGVSSAAIALMKFFA